MQQCGASAFNTLRHWHKLGEVESECTWHNRLGGLCAKIIEVGGNLLKFWHRQFCLVLLVRGVWDLPERSQFGLFLMLLLLLLLLLLLPVPLLPSSSSGRVSSGNGTPHALVLHWYLQLRRSLKYGILPEPVHISQSLTLSVELSLGWFPEYQVAHF